MTNKTNEGNTEIEELKAKLKLLEAEHPAELLESRA